MRLRNITGSEEIIKNSPYVVKNPENMKGKWESLFLNKGPIYIEIGMGKGRFIMESAKAHPENNYIGIERYSSVLLRAIQKMDALEVRPENVKFICMDAKEICEVFDKEEVDRIYLNFSDPWPKDRHAKRRLPSRNFLERYEKIVAKEGKIEFKTDNRALFDFALEEIEAAGWKKDEVTFDLHNDLRLMEGNIMTEYEEKFSSLGNPICKYIIHK